MAMQKITFRRIEDIDLNAVQFVSGIDRMQRTKISLKLNCGGTLDHLAIVTPATITLYPKVGGNGNFGTMFGPKDIRQAKFQLDLTDTPLHGTTQHYDQLAAFMTAIDNRLLDFVQQNQMQVIGRKNLSRESLEMLQIRSVRPKYDKTSGVLLGHSINVSTPKFGYDGVGGQTERKINICDCKGAVIPDGVVMPGDAVCATIIADCVYTGVGGDKFGIHWSVRDVQVVAQRSALEFKTEVPEFNFYDYEFATPYEKPIWEQRADQFSD